ncbi:hypothetical protein BDZ85DRAFT_264415 [Elsinoe ampelina]|uniref:Uncharacterized protein n=1 Tax=Elsinoe ampelina TaxID=302913 RepID=A0A6A6G8C2_9PEZI|nr:hypothetical protein BDZ85DRAFT_264415 [Elsinoe ampelina]
MLSSRHNQENLTHTHLTAAAAKPLNAHPKTPFRARHDENAVLPTKATLGKPTALFTTPATTKVRPVLGAKTTNAKALQTPAPAGGKAKPIPASTQKISPRLKRTKVRIHAPSPEAKEIDPDAEVPDVEYCPHPRNVTPPLEHGPEDFEELIQSGMFTQENIIKSTLARPGWGDMEYRQDADRRREMMKSVEDRVNEALEGDVGLELLNLEDPDQAELRDLMLAKKERERKGVSTMNAKSAASMLGGLQDRKVPSFAAPTKSTRMRAEATGQGKENVNDRFMTAKAASKTTMGYSRGRQVSATKRAPLSNAHRAPVLKVAPKKEEAKGRKLEDVVKPVSPDLEADDRERNWIDEELEKLACEDFVLDY